jgi:hypothetical protein
MTLTRPAPLLAPRPLAFWRRVGAGFGLGVGLGVGLCGGWVGSAAAQSLTPAELAARAMASAPVRALANAKAQTISSRDLVQAQNEAQLDAIRQAILDATLERPTRVISSAWVDDKGALHESAHFHSEAQVRGVRVLSYVQDDEPKTRVSAEVLPWGWKPLGADKTCAAPPRPWRLPLLVQTVVPEGFSGPQQFASQTLLNLAQQSWTQNMQASQRWRTQALAAYEAPAAGNTYMQALTGREEAPSGWTAEMSLKPHAPELARTWSERMSRGLVMPEEVWRWTLSLSLGQRHTPAGQMAVQWQVSEVIAISPAAMAQNPTAWAQQVQGQLQAHMQSWVAQLDKRSACEPVQFHVRRQNGAKQLELQAGVDSGLRPGDRVLLMNPSQVPSRMLEAGVAQHLALAQVVKVGPHRTELQPLAGPALTSQGPWMALPL